LPPNNADMDGSAPAPPKSSRLGAHGAIVVSLVLIFLALLGIGNELRFQGCVARQDREALIAATKNPRNPPPVPLKCHRVPFR
jgi:hypothetical protein